MSEEEYKLNINQLNVLFYNIFRKLSLVSMLTTPMSTGLWGRSATENSLITILVSQYTTGTQKLSGKGWKC